MNPLLAATGIGAVRATVGAVQANQERQRKKGLISKAYGLGEQRLNLEQGDTRQSQGEGLIARGLAGGGGIVDPGAVRPGQATDVTGAHDLGGQAVADERREQSLQQDSLYGDYKAALSDNKAAGTAGIIGSILGGVSTAANAYGTLSAMHGAGSGYEKAPMPGPWGGVDPVNPLGRGAWARPSGTGPTTGGFNIFSPQQGMGSY